MRKRRLLDDRTTNTVKLAKVSSNKHRRQHSSDDDDTFPKKLPKTLPDDQTNDCCYLPDDNRYNNGAMVLWKPLHSEIEQLIAYTGLNYQYQEIHHPTSPNFPILNLCQPRK